MILDRFRLTGQAAVVTGAGRGIGAATAALAHDITGKIIEVDGGLSQPDLDLGRPDL
ncbi:MAG TPA: hypothetical protein VFW50_09730 [Streptosporangiaceae bacterium]|nr:hypothetical protein [Streptosporangiaceae bacterium]